MTVKRIKLYESKAWLENYFFVRQFSIEQISIIAKCSPNTIRSNLKKHGLIQ